MSSGILSPLTTNEAFQAPTLCWAVLLAPHFVQGLYEFVSYVSLYFRFLKGLKQSMYLWIEWIMERCYLHL